MSEPPMTGPHDRTPPTRALAEAEIDAIAARAAERGAQKTLAKLGLENGHAARDIRDLRSLLAAVRAARRTFWQTLIRIATTGLILVIIAGIAVHLKLFKGD